MVLGAKTSLIMYLQPWSEFMALNPLIWRISPISSKTKILRVHPKSKEKSLDLGKKPRLELVPCVEVTLVSKFHPIWWHVAQESKVRRNFHGGPDISGNFTRYIRQNPTYPINGRTCPLDSFQPDVHSVFSPYFANRVSV
jgi:hypothetical protein